MKVFISHALTDQDILKRIKETLEPHGLQLNIAEHYVDIERSITQKIENMIIQSDIALILLTQNGFNSHFVQQEIGYIKSLNKPFIQVVQSGFENKIKGFNYGHDYFELDPNHPNIVL
jgi:nucleoside 2-deoxyribosyltransferase